MLLRLMSATALLLSAHGATAAPTVSDKTISWPDDGWYQVQVVNDYGLVEVCQGGRSCVVPAGEYVVINHSTGERFEGISVAGISVVGNVISWPDDGWYQVLDENTYLEVCAGTRTCEASDGSYLVINHSTGERVGGIVVGEAAVGQVGKPIATIADTGNNIIPTGTAPGRINSGVAPLAEAGPDRASVLGDTVTLYGGDSIDRDGTLTSYKWRENGFLLGEGISLNVQLSLGVHTVELTVTDNSGASASDSMKVTVFGSGGVSIGAYVGDVVKILDALPVSKSQINSHMTPVAEANGYVYTANIEPGPNGDENGTNLLTVVRKGRQLSSGQWSWDSVVVEDRTVYDEWHTAPSIEVDRDGQVHVVYNMHNIPWQYKRTVQPHDIDSFEFHGQSVTQEQINAWKLDNVTAFPSLGHADIPGTQITYPRFEKDPNGELYVAYRFAARPNRDWAERTFSAGIAEYSRTDKTWKSIGVPLNLTSSDYDYHPDAPATSTPFAGKMGWTAYHPSIVFDEQSGMGVMMLWRGGTAGPNTFKPCFAWSDNKQNFRTLQGASLSLPLQPEECGNIGLSDSDVFNNLADSEMDSKGNIYITLETVVGPRLLLSYNASQGQWHKETTPSRASEIFLDLDDNLWAVASGPKLYKRASMTSSWQEIYADSGSNQCFPRATVSGDGSAAFIHSHNCETKELSLYGVRLKP